MVMRNLYAGDALDPRHGHVKFLITLIVRSLPPSSGSLFSIINLSLSLSLRVMSVWSVICKVAEPSP
jgi:hypothetical protein